MLQQYPEIEEVISFPFYNEHIPEFESYPYSLDISNITYLKIANWLYYKNWKGTVDPDQLTSINNNKYRIRITVFADLFNISWYFHELAL